MSRREPREDYVRESQGTEDFVGNRKFGLDAAEMGFDQGTKMVKMDCRKINGWRGTGRVEGGRARERLGVAAVMET